MADFPKVMFKAHGGQSITPIKVVGATNEFYMTAVPGRDGREPTARREAKEGKNDAYPHLYCDTPEQAQAWLLERNAEQIEIAKNRIKELERIAQKIREIPID